MDTQFKCPCGEILTAHEEEVHKTIACHHCGRILVVPAIPVAAGLGGLVDADDLVEAEVLPRRAQETILAEERPAARKAGVNGMAVASLVLGIVGPFLGILSVVAGVLAIIFGGVAVRGIAASPRTQGRGMAIAGIALGSLSVILGITLILASYGGRPPENSLDVICSLF